MTLTLRPLTAADTQAMADIAGDYDAHHNGVGDRPSADDMHDWWNRVDESVGVEENGALVAIGYLRGRGSYSIGDVFVHPEARGRGAGSLLLDWVEQTTADLGLGAARVGLSSRDAAGKDLLARRGFRYIRSFYRMAVDFDEQPPAPVWPDGFTCALEPGEEHLLYETLEEAFEDHWGFEPRPFEDWIARNGPLADRLCYLVRTDDGRPAAAQICDEDRWGAALVGILGVRPPWRRHGIGEALLRQAFHDLYARGRSRIALGVDAENTTGATRLYERVGMHVVLQDDAYEKQLEPRH